MDNIFLLALIPTGMSFVLNWTLTNFMDIKVWIAIHLAMYPFIVLALYILL